MFQSFAREPLDAFASVLLRAPCETPGPTLLASPSPMQNVTGECVKRAHFFVLFAVLSFPTFESAQEDFKPERFNYFPKEVTLKIHDDLDL